MYTIAFQPGALYNTSHGFARSVAGSICEELSQEAVQTARRLCCHYKVDVNYLKQYM